MYVGYVHPDIVADLQGESISGSNIQGWRAPHVYAQPNEIWTGELGAFEGVRWIETPRAPFFQGAGASATAGTYTMTTATTGTFTGNAPQVGAALSTKSGGVTVTGTVTVATVSSNTFTVSGTGSVTLAGDNTVTIAAAGVNVYGTLILGRQALAKAYSMVDGNGAFPQVVPGPITDRLRRFVPLGWYWLGAYGIFRQASVIRLESASLLGSDLNSATFSPAVDAGESGSPQA